MIIIGLGYSILYSGWTEITEISISGLKTLNADQIYPFIYSGMDERNLPILKIKYLKNNLFFDSEYIKTNILANFPIIKSIEIKKEYPHKINVEIMERTVIGTWCYENDDDSTSLTTSCQYFDRDGVLWGKALRSSGSLFLMVQDDRKPPENRKNIDLDFWQKIEPLIDGLNKLDINTTKTIIPSDSISDFQVQTGKGYYIIFSKDTDVSAQIEVLRIFLDNKGEDFTANYIDLRIEGRVYYK